MQLREATSAITADVCLVLEGTYPYVAGGVSSWVHDIVRSLPERSFALMHIGPQPGMYHGLRYQLPANVTGLAEHYCIDRDSLPDEHSHEAVTRRIRTRKLSTSPVRSRSLTALRRMHLDDAVDDQLIDDLAAADLSVEQLLHSSQVFDVVTEIARALAPRTPFLEFFWHFRSMHVPLLRLLGVQAPPAAVYHSVSTGYAGVVAAVASRRTGQPMLLTEHGIYARERDMELSHATWLTDAAVDLRVPRLSQSPLRRFWSRFFARLSQIAYHQTARIITLSEVNRRKQLADGARPEKTSIVANGVDVDALTAAVSAPTARAPNARMKVGFVGRVVPIKDVLTFIKACDLALRDVALDVALIGPDEEDPAYATRCRELVATLGREQEIRFVGSRKLTEIYGDLDVCVLTSFSEGQPLVILEAHAFGVPVIATDVGACREMLEGTGRDRSFGPGGIVTRVAAPEETAAALVLLARSAELRRQMGEAGRARVRASYTKAGMIAAYRTLYDDFAGGS